MYTGLPSNPCTGMALALKCPAQDLHGRTEDTGYWIGAQPRSKSMRSLVPVLFIPMLTILLA